MIVFVIFPFFVSKRVGAAKSKVDITIAYIKGEAIKLTQIKKEDKKPLLIEPVANKAGELRSDTYSPLANSKPLFSITYNLKSKKNLIKQPKTDSMNCNLTPPSCISTLTIPTLLPADTAPTKECINSGGNTLLSSSHEFLGNSCKIINSIVSADSQSDVNNDIKNKLKRKILMNIETKSKRCHVDEDPNVKAKDKNTNTSSQINAEANEKFGKNIKLVNKSKQKLSVRSEEILSLKLRIYDRLNNFSSRKSSKFKKTSIHLTNISNHIQNFPAPIESKKIPYSIFFTIIETRKALYDFFMKSKLYKSFIRYYYNEKSEYKKTLYPSKICDNVFDIALNAFLKDKNNKKELDFNVNDEFLSFSDNDKLVVAKMCLDINLMMQLGKFSFQKLYDEIAATNLRYNGLDIVKSKYLFDRLLSIFYNNLNDVLTIFPYCRIIKQYFDVVGYKHIILCNEKETFVFTILIFFFFHLFKTNWCDKIIEFEKIKKSWNPEFVIKSSDMKRGTIKIKNLKSLYIGIKIEFGKLLTYILTPFLTTDTSKRFITMIAFEEIAIYRAKIKRDKGLKCKNNYFKDLPFLNFSKLFFAAEIVEFIRNNEFACVYIDEAWKNICEIIDLKKDIVTYFDLKYTRYMYSLETFEEFFLRFDRRLQYILTYKIYHFDATQIFATVNQAKLVQISHQEEINVYSQQLQNYSKKNNSGMKFFFNRINEITNESLTNVKVLSFLSNLNIFIIHLNQKILEKNRKVALIFALYLELHKRATELHELTYQSCILYYM
ncbi:hypothetical protein COBT_000454 [Conglomerata obtusa]